MVLRVAINGFGRIGRLVLRAIQETRCTDIQVVAINDIITPEAAVFLLKHDSVHGVFPADVHLKNHHTLCVDGSCISLTTISNPNELPWKECAIDMVFECTGRFTKRSEAVRHLTAGATRVLLSAPGQEADYTTVYGVNHTGLSAQHQVVSNASCTTNCLAPVALVLHQVFEIEKGYVTTIHAYTGDQRIIDTAHKDLRRARAAAVNMIPTSTGAAKAVGLVVPTLQGKLDGTAIRVPMPNVSLIDGVFVLGKSVTAEEVNSAFAYAAENDLKGVLALSDEPLVSSDFIHAQASATVDLPSTQIVEGSLCRVMAWYDNEWGFACRMLDVARFWATKLP
jgi:glyceraldehyde 3-phosphate dehydrogenase